MKREKMAKAIWCSKCGISIDHKRVDVVVKKFMNEDWREESWECPTCGTRTDIYINERVSD